MGASRSIAAALLCIAMILASPGKSAGQGLAQVNLAGVPPVLPSPVVSEVAMLFEQGRFPMTFVFSSPDRQSSAFVFRVLLEREGEVVLDLTSEPTSYTRGVYTYTTLDADPPITFAARYSDLVSALGAGLDQDLERTGLLSEGLYTLSVEAIPVDADEFVIAVPATAMFSVQYLEPPLLLSPSADEVLRDDMPVFSWLPVMGGPSGTLFDYEFLLVEVYSEQEPAQAVEANRPLEQLMVTGLTTLPYTVDRLPLEAGRRYAWQVTARDADGLVPFADGGRSEISSFVYAPGGTGLAEWVYPFSDPPVVFNLSAAELTSAGYLASGYFDGRVGDAPVTGVFDDLLLDAVRLDVVSGSVTLLGDLAEAVGAVESDASQHLRVDDTPPTPPFVSARIGRGRAGERLDIVIGPSEDAESGIRLVRYRLAPVEDPSAQVVDPGWAFWYSAFESPREAGRFSGGSYVIDLPPEAVSALRQDRLQLELRLTNGLGLETAFKSQVGPATDVSPPVVVEPVLTYTGYYDLDRPNAVQIAKMRVSDAESGVQMIEYRVLGPGERVGEWNVLAAPGQRSYRTPTVAVQLEPVDADGEIQIEFRVTNGARLARTWVEDLYIDIDETEPVNVGPMARFVTSESDPRIEISRDAVADYQSGIVEMSYRVVDDEQPTRVYVDWTRFPPGPVAEVKRTQLNFTTRRRVRVEVTAENGAGLTSTFEEVLLVPELEIGDRTPPVVPSVSLRVVRSGGGQVLLELRVGRSSDAETGISRVQYRVEDVANGADLTGWVDVSAAGGGDFAGASETISVRLPRGVQALRAVVRVVNGAGAASTAGARVAVASADTTPPEIRSIQVYAQAGRVLAFVDGLSDPESSVERVDYRLLGPGSTPLTNWTVHSIVPAGRPSYGRQLLRADIPAGASGVVVFQLRVTNGAGLESIAEERVTLER